MGSDLAMHHSPPDMPRSPLAGAEALATVRANLISIYRLTGIHALLDWDQQVHLPRSAGETRAEHLETLASLIHSHRTSPPFVKALEDLMSRSTELSPDDQVIVRETHREVERARRLPAEFVAERARTEAECYQVWARARPESDLAAVLPLLERIVTLKRHEAELLGFEENPYDALLDLYEPGMRFSVVGPLLASLARELTPICGELARKTSTHPTSPGLTVEVQRQFAFNRRLIGLLGLSAEGSRLDQAPHPFMTNLGVGDIRLTTRLDPNDYLSGIFSTLHETGHGLYEAGLPPEHRGTPLAMPVSLGVHESQSRLWENMIGRSHAFTRFLHGLLKTELPDVARATSPEMLWKQQNRVAPSLIRVDADEVTYSLHIVIRMELEEALINRRLEVRDLADAWNEGYRRHLGIVAPNHRDGVMQDVHWFSGSFGYFPTYALGNIYGGMMLGALRRDLPTLSAQIEAGEFLPLLAWLREKVHRHGMRYRPVELVERIAGAPLSITPFLDYVREKHALGTSGG